MAVECAFGRLKGRWQYLLKKMDVSISRVPTIVSSCFVLHNLCVSQGNECLEEVNEPAKLREPDVPQEQTAEPHNVRRALH
ncbi:hypothetical protein N1851_033784 [Merluccius polli]|uniref:DDE Tnp4 domain-containing protein n=1 Tax=Merluccius polli TaxID=89951 RepID=A0AA47M0V0_MERPO|nr:hypothetical protein N1851_033784 [Merluccius polli]